jgi:hypothetical protein
VEWKRIRGRSKGRNILPIPFTGGGEDFAVKISDEELESLKDNSGDIRFHKVFQWLLPRFPKEHNNSDDGGSDAGTDSERVSNDTSDDDSSEMSDDGSSKNSGDKSNNQNEIDDSSDGDGDDTFFEFMAARMRNYMIHIMRTKSFKPRFYNPGNGKVITAGHVARFFGCHMGRMLRGFPSMMDTWSTRESLDAVGAVKDSMPQDAYREMHRCMHFSDDWEDADGDSDWESLYSDQRFGPSRDVAKHRQKFEHIEDAFNKRWKECVHFGKWLTMDESRVAGWYHSNITVGPEPKPICTGATIHSMCITHGPLRSYKVHCRVYGGSSDEGLNTKHVNTVTLQKWVNLLSTLLEEFKGVGHCVTMDSAYMGDIMALIGRLEWKINMVGTSQSDRTGADVADARADMMIGTYESVFFQHNTHPLVYAMWADNNIVKTLSNFHLPIVLAEGEGVLRKK